MKFLKKIAAAAAAALVAAGISSVAVFAEEAYKLHIDTEKASVGETVSVDVIIDTGSTGVGAISFMLNYDPEELELVSAQLGEALNGSDWFTDNLNLDTAGKIGFGCLATDKGFSEKSTVLISASFNVLKPNSQLTLDEVVIAADNMDTTDITDQGSIEGTVIPCSHKNTEETVIEATCKDEGKKEAVCKDCGEAVSSEVLPKTDNHAWGEGKTVKAPTCTEKGTISYTCSVCGTTKTEDAEALGHDWDNGTVTTEPNCTEKGEKTYTCSNCDEIKTEEISALGHGWGEWEVTKEATADEEGEETRECKVCGEKETRIIEKLPSEDTSTEAPAVTTAEYTGGDFYLPETSAAAADTSVSAVETAADLSTVSTSGQTAEAVNETVNTAAPVSDAAPVNTGNADTYVTSAAESSTGSVGNSDNANVPTGIVFSVIPAALAAVGLALSKKRK